MYLVFNSFFLIKPQNYKKTHNTPTNPGIISHWDTGREFINHLRAVDKYIEVVAKLDAVF